jgi:hypothetical protein
MATLPIVADKQALAVRHQSCWQATREWLIAIGTVGANVSNRRRRRSAHEVRVLVTSVHRIAPDGTPVERLPLDTVALIWSNLPFDGGISS